MEEGLSASQRLQKRLFDMLLAVIGLILTGWLIVIAFIAASIDTHGNGFFTQRRVGKDGKLFSVVKIKTMRPSKSDTTTVTVTGDPRVTALGYVLRKSKIDELPQLWNVLTGDMSFVGPRPDVEGFADKLCGEQRLVLTIRPGLTGPATLKYRDEESLLATVKDPERYNREVIYLDKVKINLEYICNWTLVGDLKYIWQTVWG